MKPHLLALFTLLPCLALAQSSTNTDQPPPPPPGGGPGEWHHHGPPNADEMLAHLTKQLDLTSSQQEEIKPMLVSEVAQMKSIHEDTSLSEEDQHAQMKSLHEATSKQIESVLTADQVKKFEQMHQHHGPPPPPPSGQ